MWRSGFSSCPLMPSCLLFILSTQPAILLFHAFRPHFSLLSHQNSPSRDQHRWNCFDLQMEEMLIGSADTQQVLVELRWQKESLINVVIVMKLTDAFSRGIDLSLKGDKKRAVTLNPMTLQGQGNFSWGYVSAPCGLWLEDIPVSQKCGGEHNNYH